MPRATNRPSAHRRKKKILKRTKGYWGNRKNVWANAKNTYEKGLLHAYTGRKLKKRDYRSLWIIRINAAVREYGMSYSEFMGKINQKGIKLNRKVLADLAMNNPEDFRTIVEEIKAI